MKYLLLSVFIVLTLFLLGMHLHLFPPAAATCIACDGLLCCNPPPTSAPPPGGGGPGSSPVPNPTTGAVSTINEKCYDAGGNLIKDDCIGCGNVPAPGCQIPLGAECGSCGGGGSVCYGQCTGNVQSCGWSTCPDSDCASGICSWNVDRTWCRSWDCTNLCNTGPGGCTTPGCTWVAAGTCVTGCSAACGGGICTDVCGHQFICNTQQCNVPPQATVDCPVSPVGASAQFTVHATDANSNLYSMAFDFSPSTSQSWSRLNDDGTTGSDLTPNVSLSGGTGTITGTWNPTANDAGKSFWMVPHVYDSQGGECMSNPWGVTPPVVNCSDPAGNSRCLVTVSTPTPTPTPYLNVYIRNPAGGAYSQEICNAGWTCGTTTGTFLDCALRSAYTVPILQTYSCSGARIPSYVFADLLGVTPVPTAGYENPNNNTSAFFGWPKWDTGSKDVTLVSAYNIRGWIYNEGTANPPTRDASDSLLSGYGANLSSWPNLVPTIAQGTSVGSPLSPYSANYILNKVSNGSYYVYLPVTPTGSVLWSRPTPGQQYTNPVNVSVQGSSQTADFPFVTVTLTPVPTITPSATPTSTPPPIPPTITSTIIPPPCTIPLPTPVLVAPAHQMCINTKPAFSATVNNPNKDSVWAHFYSNAYETWSHNGSVQPYTGGNSQWSPDGSVLNSTGGYWWTAYTQSSGCTKSADAPAFLLNMDYSAPAKPTAPDCTLVKQNLGPPDPPDGKCTFSCSWPADLETDNSCSGTTSDTVNYHPLFGTSPGAGDLSDPGWVDGSKLTTTLNNVADGQLVYTQLTARDALGNTSAASDTGGPFTCPCIVGGSCGLTPTPSPTGSPTPTSTVAPTPNDTPAPTIPPTPTPGDWVQVQGGDTYQKAYNYPVPAGQNFITNLPGDNYNTGIGWSGLGSWNFGFGNLSVPNKKVGNLLSNTYDFNYFVESLKNKSTPVTPNCLPICYVGTSTDLDTSHSIYSYSVKGFYELDPNFWKINTVPKTPVTIFLISGSLKITQDFSIPAGDTVVFVANGNIYVDSSVTKIPGLYISSQIFTVALGTSKFELDGMAYANTFTLNRIVRDPNNPTYKFIYQPQYMVALLSYLGRTQVDWQEVKP